jgi:hypothetical protein
MFCSKCGNALTDGAKFCQRCGTPVPIANVTADAAPPIEAAPVPEPPVETIPEPPVEAAPVPEPPVETIPEPPVETAPVPEPAPYVPEPTPEPTPTPAPAPYAPQPAPAYYAPQPQPAQPYYGGPTLNKKEKLAGAVLLRFAAVIWLIFALFTFIYAVVYIMADNYGIPWNLTGLISWLANAALLGNFDGVLGDLLLTLGVGGDYYSWMYPALCFFDAIITGIFAIIVLATAGKKKGGSFAITIGIIYLIATIAGFILIVLAPARYGYSFSDYWYDGIAGFLRSAVSWYVLPVIIPILLIIGGARNKKKVLK